MACLVCIVSQQAWLCLPALSAELVEGMPSRGALPACHLGGLGLTSPAQVVVWLGPHNKWKEFECKVQQL